MSRKQARAPQQSAKITPASGPDVPAEASNRSTALRVGALAGIALLALAAWYFFSARQPGEPALKSGSGAVAVAATYAGSQSCAQCHAAESKAWQASQHAVAMQHATERTVLGDFNDATYSLPGREFRVLPS